eukprot:TRINITY_DN14058_c0_g1_i2.p2 TRINITY_DN14058_c0_g1~~TRINITY_DN14058_c0_g1_i2.p2  ORF type:complete len:269 (-),score=71.69 TRINITY_DN14058_c0_g1_i2:375-1181(-)
MLRSLVGSEMCIRDSRKWEYDAAANPPDKPSRPFEPPPPPSRVVDLKGRRLQVMVKLASVMLTPDNPEYPGGVWHVEGMKNEQIVASGIFYFDCKNITPSHLEFRTAIDPFDVHYEQGDAAGVRAMYGLEADGPLVEHLGKVQTVAGLCVGFPNTFQHRVQAFRLSDATQAGHRKILAFFLVDPSKRVLSTASVPPQQAAWFVPELGKLGRFRGLSPHLLDIIVGFLDWPLSRGQAEGYREELMLERRRFVDQHTQEVFERPFSLCEH